jgi:hypothetical protein
VAGCHARAQYVPRSTQDSDALALAQQAAGRQQDKGGKGE